MSVAEANPSSQIVPVGALNQYLYCPRRYWYYRFFDPEDRSADLINGRRRHDRQSRHPDWIRERYFRSEELGLHGRVDVLDSERNDRDFPVPVERKRATSGRYYWNDEIQVTAYGLLIETTLGAVDTVEYGVIYLYETDKRHRIELTEDRRQSVREVRDEIRSLQPDEPPDIVENRNKCSGCSVRHYCQPETEAYLEHHGANVTSLFEGGSQDDV
jgi:CRISPR-associated exonuclease Cas4